MTPPKVSIITLTYNNEQFISNAVNSILTQNYPRIEVIVRDDGSKHFHPEQIRKLFEGKEDRLEGLRIEQSPTNMGTVRNFNEAIRLTTGDIIVPLSCDDMFADENVVSDIVKQFQTTNCHLCSAQRLGRQSGTVAPAKETVTNFENSNRERRFSRLCYSNFISGAALYYSKQATKLLASLEGEFILLEDYPMVLLSVLQGLEISFMDRTTIIYNETGVSQKKTVHPKLKEDYKRVYETIIFPNAQELTKSMTRYLRYRYLRQFKGDAWWKNIDHSLQYGDIFAKMSIWKLCSLITGRPVDVFEKLMQV